MHVGSNVRQMLTSYMAAFRRAYYKAPFYTRAHAFSFGSLYLQPSIKALNYIDYGRYCGPHYWAYFHTKDIVDKVWVYASLTHSIEDHRSMLYFIVILLN